MCPDKIWRQIVTLQDAIDNGWDLTDIDEIRDENSPEEYDNLYGCQFIKSGENAFDYNQLINCGADGYDDWPDWPVCLAPDGRSSGVDWLRPQRVERQR